MSTLARLSALAASFLFLGFNFVSPVSAAVQYYTLTMSAPSTVVEGANLNLTLTCSVPSPVSATGKLAGRLNIRNSSKQTAYGGGAAMGYDAYQFGTLAAGTKTATIKFSLKPKSAPAGDTITITASCNSGQANMVDGIPSDYSNKVTKTFKVVAKEKTPEQVAAEKEQVELKANLMKISNGFKVAGFSFADFLGASKEKAAAFPSFALTNANGSVTFNASLNLIDKTYAEQADKLKDLVKLGKGVIEIDSIALPDLNKAAKVTFKGLNLSSAADVQVLRNGEDYTDMLKNVKYDKATQTLNFEVPGFSKYEVAAGLVVATPEINDAKGSAVVKGTVSDLDSKVTVSVNGAAAKDVTLDENGNFTSDSVTLVKGENKIEIIAKGVTGEQKELKTFNYGTTTIDPLGIFAAVIICLALLGALAAGVAYYMAHNGAEKHAHKNSKEHSDKK